MIKEYFKGKQHAEKATSKESPEYVKKQQNHDKHLSLNGWSEKWNYVFVDATWAHCIDKNENRNENDYRPETKL